jgi:hypothetical protein
MPLRSTRVRKANIHSRTLRIAHNVTGLGARFARPTPPVSRAEIVGIYATSTSFISPFRICTSRRTPSAHCWHLSSVHVVLEIRVVVQGRGVHVGPRGVVVVSLFAEPRRNERCSDARNCNSCHGASRNTAGHGGSVDRCEKATNVVSVALPAKVNQRLNDLLLTLARRKILGVLRLEAAQRSVTGRGRHSATQDLVNAAKQRITSVGRAHNLHTRPVCCRLILGEKLVLGRGSEENPGRDARGDASVVCAVARRTARIVTRVPIGLRCIKLADGRATLVWDTGTRAWIREDAATRRQRANASLTGARYRAHSKVGHAEAVLAIVRGANVVLRRAAELLHTRCLAVVSLRRPVGLARLHVDHTRRGAIIVARSRETGVRRRRAQAWLAPCARRRIHWIVDARASWRTRVARVCCAHLEVVTEPCSSAERRQTARGLVARVHDANVVAVAGARRHNVARASSTVAAIRKALVCLADVALGLVVAETRLRRNARRAERLRRGVANCVALPLCVDALVARAKVGRQRARRHIVHALARQRSVIDQPTSAICQAHAQLAKGVRALDRSVDAALHRVASGCAAHRRSADNVSAIAISRRRVAHKRRARRIGRAGHCHSVYASAADARVCRAEIVVIANRRNFRRRPRRRSAPSGVVAHSDAALVCSGACNRHVVARACHNVTRLACARRMIVAQGLTLGQRLRYKCAANLRVASALQALVRTDRAKLQQVDGIARQSCRIACHVGAQRARRARVDGDVGTIPKRIRRRWRGIGDSSQASGSRARIRQCATLFRSRHAHRDRTERRRVGARKVTARAVR